MKKSLALLALFCVAVFAQADPCKDETQKAEILYDMCVKFDAQSQSYMDCTKLYIEQKVKASEACKAAVPEPAPVAAPAVIPVAPWQTPAPALAPASAPAPVLAPAPALAVTTAATAVKSVAQALKESSLAGGCVADFTRLMESDGFSMGNFVKNLPPAVAKVKVQMKSPFGKPKDGDVTSVGLTVGCIKALPESPAEIQGLLKDIALKVGLDFAAGAAEDYISTNIPKEGDSGGGVFKTVMSVGLIGGGLGSLIYGYMQDSKVSDSIKEREGKVAIEARDNRNMSYGIGAGLLVVGLGVVIIF